MKKFSGDKEKYIKCKNYLYNKGYVVNDAIHIGDNRFEFQEDFNISRLGCHDMHKILVLEDAEGKIQYKTKVVGFMCCD